MNQSSEILLSRKKLLAPTQILVTAGVGRVKIRQMLVLAVRERLRRLRGERDWTQAELATRAGVEVTTVHRVENTKKMPAYKPDFDSIERLAKAFGFPSLATFLQSVESETLTSPVIPPASPLEPQPQGGPTDVPASDRRIAVLERQLAEQVALIRDLETTVRGLSSTLTRQMETSAPASTGRTRPAPKRHKHRAG